jgi:siroheme synthase (precorrin-2 oxidase/ferrochelatase)
MTSATAFSRLSAQIVLLIGSDCVAAELVLRLADAGARVRWFSDNLDVAEELWLSGQPAQIEVAFREPHAADFETAAVVIVTTEGPAAACAARRARALRRPVAVLGRPELSTFDLDDMDDDVSGGDPTGHHPWQRTSAWLAAQLFRGIKVLAGLPRTFWA